MSQSPFGDGRQQSGSQNFDARTASLLNRLATRRQSSPLLTSSSSAQPKQVESTVLSPISTTPNKLGSLLAMNRASSPATISGPRASTDFQTKGPAIQQFQPSNRAPSLAFPVKTQPQNSSSSSMGIQGRLVNLQLGSSAAKTSTVPGFRLSSASSTVSDEGHSSPLLLGRTDSTPEQVLDQLAGSSPSPQVLIRTKEEKAANPERLNLDRRKYVWGGELRDRVDPRLLSRVRCKRGSWCARMQNAGIRLSWRPFATAPFAPHLPICHRSASSDSPSWLLPPVSRSSPSSFGSSRPSLPILSLPILSVLCRTPGPHLRTCVRGARCGGGVLRLLRCGTEGTPSQLLNRGRISRGRMNTRLEQIAYSPTPPALGTSRAA